MEEQVKQPIIAIIGRPNVGKSSLFNAILKRRMAIVHEECGVTRDRVAAPSRWEGRAFQIIDTGGLGTYSSQTKNVDRWDTGIRKQVEIAIEDADIIFFMTDALAGLMPLDHEISKRVRESGKKVYCVINKVDNPKIEAQSSEFLNLGFDGVYPISTLHNKGISFLLDDVLLKYPETSKHLKERSFRITVLGRPNVGKSSIVNALLGEDRVMVSEIAGTTRDSVNTEFTMEYKGENLPVTLIDTAGIRKRSKVDTVIETFSIMRAEAAVKNSQLVLFVVEAKKDGLTAQDRRIAKIIAEAGRACIVVANKWDQCKSESPEAVLKELYYTLPRMTFAPVVFTCALSKYNFGNLLDSIAEVMEQLEIKVTTSMLNQVLIDAFKKNAPPFVKNKAFKVYYGTMIGNDPPRFQLFVNNTKLCTKNYQGYLMNYLRKSFIFKGLPIVLIMKERTKKEDFYDKDKRSGKAKSFKSNVRKKTHRRYSSKNKKK